VTKTEVYTILRDVCIMSNRLTYIYVRCKYWRNRSARQCLPPPLFVTQKGCRSEFQDPPIKSFTSKIFFFDYTYLSKMNSTESMLIIISPIKPIFLLLKTIFPPDRFFKFMMQFSASAKNALVICRRNIHLWKRFFERVLTEWISRTYYVPR
jgi:hypothetical protein